MTLLTDITFDCSFISEEHVYVCPLVMQTAAGYDINQAEPVYIIVEKSQLRIWMPEATDVSVNTTGSGSVKFEMNSPMLENQQIKLVYDSEAIAAYNSTNNTDYTIIKIWNVLLSKNITFPKKVLSELGECGIM